ncbi:hypothetical protein [Glycomyces sp. NRRL B-16210]|uniref:hypothetical protein n=1 Tax=Glycomyces sp. NRRL B-16210 TaxID=1463821 RepID=UPI0004C1976A|nr:hypothetical protein [Glycomyces sp. NRRL B-16210]
MSGTVKHVVGEGILRIPKHEGEVGRFGTVALATRDGWMILTGVPKGIKAELFAVKLKKVATTRRRWLRPGQTVRTRTVEIPVLLGIGTVFTEPLSDASTPDTVGVRPDRPSPAPWLDIAALKEVEGHFVRLELHRPPELRESD